MRSRTWVALGATLGSAAAYLWRLSNEPIDVVVEEVPVLLEPNPYPDFPWHHFTWEYKIPEHWVEEAIAHFEKPWQPAPPTSKTTVAVAKVPGPTSSLKLQPPSPSPAPYEDVKTEERNWKPAQWKYAADWPKTHVAISGIPGVGRPLPEDGVLNAHWEASPEEKAYRETMQTWWTKLDEVRKLLTSYSTMVLPRDLNKVIRGEEAVETLKQAVEDHAKVVIKARKAVKELGALLDSPPKHPSQQ